MGAAVIGLAIVAFALLRTGRVAQLFEYEQQPVAATASFLSIVAVLFVIAVASLAAAARFPSRPGREAA